MSASQDPNAADSPSQADNRLPRLWPAPSDRLITGVFLAFGVAVRLRQYVFDRSLWVDESLLVLNLLSRSARELLKPLDLHQAAPLGFLMLEKAAIHFFGTGEMALRLVPFLAGIASLFLFAAVAKKFLVPGAVPVAVGLFAVCGPLIYYSSESKQYSCDVAVALLLYFIADTVISGRARWTGTLILSLTAALCLWFSQPSLFVVAAIGITWLWAAARKRDRSALIHALFFGSITAASFGLSYFVSLRHLLRDTWLTEYWSGAFLPMPPFSPAAVRWVIYAWFQMCQDPLGLTFVGIATAAAAIGAKGMLREDWKRLVMVALPLLLALLASGLQRYPFRGRLLLFAVPSLLLLMAAGLAEIRAKTRTAVPGLGALLIGLLFFQPTLEAARHLVKPQGLEEIRPVLAYVEQHRMSGDILYCYNDAEWALDYYTLRQVIHPIPTVIGVVSRDDWSKYRQDIDQLRGNPRVWVLFSHVYRGGGADEERLFLDYLDSVGKRQDSYQAEGASVYLYDLRSW